MRIDRAVEATVREALTSVIKRDPDRLARALATYRNEAAALEGMRLATMLALFVLYDQSGGQPPTGEEISMVAEDVSTRVDWAGLAAAEVETFITMAVSGEPAHRALRPDRITLLAYAIAAYLISGYREDDEEWWDHLDRAEAAIEAIAPR